MTFGKASAKLLLVAAAAALALGAGITVVSAQSGEITRSASSWPVPVGSPTPTHHGRGLS
ncbi:hypothetical protein AB0L41_48270 [Amycolatopsis mediterranei]|uniref:hypothetical protein n=1 Tax=Amycolatopsis mediterranei TaxID=33910 RepID=UPI0034129A78